MLIQDGYNDEVQYLPCLKHLISFYHQPTFAFAHAYKWQAGRQANTGTLNRAFASSTASVTGVQCESGLIASSAGCWWQADAFADGTLAHNTPKQNNWGVNCSAGAAVEAR